MGRIKKNGQVDYFKCLQESEVARINNAVNKFLEAYACSQAILSEYCECFGLGTGTALKLDAGFAGGMQFCKTCGAVTGAIMVLG